MVFLVNGYFNIEPMVQNYVDHEIVKVIFHFVEVDVIVTVIVSIFAVMKVIILEHDV